MISNNDTKEILFIDEYRTVFKLTGERQVQLRFADGCNGCQ